MSRRVLRMTAFVVVLTASAVSGFVYGPTVVHAITPDTRSEAERFADRHSLPKGVGRHSLQIGMLAKHRSLFEAAARNEPGKRDELSDTVGGYFTLVGNRFEYQWRFGSGHWSYAYRLIFCPNGERDLPDSFLHGGDGSHYTDPKKIDDHWFAAYEPSG